MFHLDYSFKNLMIIESDTEIAIKISIEYDIRYLIVTLLCDDIFKIFNFRNINKTLVTLFILETLRINDPSLYSLYFTLNI